MPRRRLASRGAARAAAAAASALAATLTAADVARAQNAEGFYYSEDSALMAGAVTARPADNASLWYNPAGLASVERGRVSANGSVFGLRIRRIPAAVETRVAGAEIELHGDSTDIIAVPNTLGASFRLADGVALGLGLFVTERDVRQAADDVIDEPLPEIEGATLSERVDLQSDVTKYHLGPGIGVRLAPGLRLGASVFVTYRTDVQIAQLAFGFTSPFGNGHDIVQGTVATTLLGLTGAVGFQADLGPHARIGLVARPPELFLHGSSEGAAVAASSESDDTPTSELLIARAVDPESGSSMLAPPRFTAGVVLLPVPSIEIGADVDFTTGLDDEALGISRSPVVNGRAGIRAAVSDRLVLGGGLFTDFSAQSELGEFLGAEDVDWFGGSAGATLRTPLTLADDPERKEGVVLSTTLAVRYAMGIGQARAIIVAEVDELAVRDVVFHDVMPFFGSSILF